MLKRVLLFTVIAYGLWWYFVSKNVSVVQNETKYSFDYTVEGYTKTSKLRAPMLIALHGNGDTAEHFYESFLKGLKVNRLRMIMMKGTESFSGGRIKSKAWPMDAERIRGVGDAMALAVGKLLKKYPTVDKPMLLGFSGGAGMAYYMAAHHASKFSYILPLSGKLPASLFKGGTRGNSPATVYAYHGTKDQVIPFSAGSKAVGGLKKIGLRTNFSRFVGGHLGIFTTEKPELIELIENLGETVK